MPAIPASVNVCSSAHRFCCRAILAVLSIVVIMSGFAWPLSQKREVWEALWPWSRAWGMFSWNDGRFYQLQVKGILKDGRAVPVDLSRWFTYPVAFETSRSNEFRRTADNIQALARYVCRRHNEEAVPGERMVQITITDLSWPQERGRRPHPYEVSAPRLFLRTYLEAAPCEPGGSP